MSEMADTADHLIVIGRGRLLADAACASWWPRAAATASRSARRSPAQLMTRAGRRGRDRQLADGDALTVSRPAASERIADLAVDARPAVARALAAPDDRSRRCSWT